MREEPQTQVSWRVVRGGLLGPKLHLAVRESKGQRGQAVRESADPFTRTLQRGPPLVSLLRARWRTLVALAILRLASLLELSRGDGRTLQGSGGHGILELWLFGPDFY